MMKLKVVEVLQYNGANMKVISTKEDYSQDEFGQAGKCPGQAKFESCLPNRQGGIQIFFEPWYWFFLWLRILFRTF